MKKFNLKTKTVTPEMLMEQQNRSLRDELADRFEARGYEKRPFFIFQDYIYTVDNAAEFYNTSVKDIKSIISKHRRELESDCLEIFTENGFNELAESLMNCCGSYESKTALRSEMRLSARALLKIGMLLRNSKIAQSLREYLVDMPESKTDTSFFIDEAKTPLQHRIGIPVIVTVTQTRQLPAGEIINHTFVTHRKESKHIYRGGKFKNVKAAKEAGTAAWAIDKKLCDALIKRGVKWFRIVTEETIYSCPLRYFQKHKLSYVNHHRYYGEQYFLPLQVFSMEEIMDEFME